MKNIHLLPTDKPSRLIFDKEENRLLPLQDDTVFMEYQNLVENQNIYITSDEEIKEGDWLIVNDEDVMQMKSSYDNDMSGEDIWVGDSLNGYATYKDNCKKIILTTDQDLIADGVQAIDNKFLEWFVKNPSCELVKIIDDVECLPMPNIHINKHIYKIIIPQEEPKQIKCYCGHTITCDCEPLQETIEEAAENYRQPERMYSEEEVIILLQKYRYDLSSGKTANLGDTTSIWFEQFKNI
jgi:hypothetical protein